MASGWGGPKTKWTPKLAIQLADLLTHHGVGDGPVMDLRRAAAVNSPILGQRAMQCYDYARPIIDSHCSSENDPARYREFVIAAQGILGKALKPDNESDDEDEQEVDWIQDAVIKRANKLQLTAYAIAQMCPVTESHIQRYLTKRASMSSYKLQHLLRALGMKLVAEKRSSE